MDASSTQILHELETIRAFLFIILVLAAGILFCAFIAAFSIKAGIKELLEMSRINNHVFREDAEDLLSQGNIDDALELILQRLKTHPNDIEATAFKGRAYYIAGKYHEAKRAFEDAYSLNPTWDVTVDLWQQRIKEKLDESAPKIVD